MVAYPRAFREEVGQAVVCDVRRRASELPTLRVLAWLPALLWSLLLNAIGAWADALRGRSARGATSIVGPLLPPRGQTFSWLDVKLGLRMLVKHPVMSVASVVGIAVAVAIGAGFMSFAVGYVYPDIPIHEGDRLVGLENWDVERNNEERRSLYDFVLWREEMTTVLDLTAFRPSGRNLIGEDGSVEALPLMEMTASGFDLARVPPMMGRRLTAADEAPAAPPVLVVGYDAWQSRFAGDPDVVGRDVRLGNRSHSIVGVMPPGFSFPISHQYWIPLVFDPGALKRGEGPWVFISGRLAPAVSQKEAHAELSVIGARMAAEYPDTHGTFRAQLMPFTYPIMDVNQQGGDSFFWEFLVMSGIFSLLLWVVCVNVAVLMYARTATRRGELAVRTALGANRGRILVQLFSEAFVLSSVGVLVGLGIASLGIRFGTNIVRGELPGGLPFWFDPGLQLPVLLGVAFLTLVAAAIIGVIPGIHATGRGLHAEMGRSAGASRTPMGATWTALIVVQVAVSVVAVPLAITAGWEEVRWEATSPVFDVDRYLTAWISLETEPPLGADPAEYAASLPGRYEGLIRDLRAALDAEPLVEAATFGLDQISAGPRRTLLMERDTLGAPDRVVRAVRVDTRGLETMSLSANTGRLLEMGDSDPEAHPVAVVNRAFVDRYFGQGDPLGRRLHVVAPGRRVAPPDGEEPPWSEIVGVVDNMYANPLDPYVVEPRVYVPMGGHFAAPVNLTVRVAGKDPGLIAGRIRAIATGVDPTVRVGVETLAEQRRASGAVVGIVALSVGLTVLAVVLLSSAGIYALMSFAVTQRRREIGLRSALGARGVTLLRTVFLRSLRQIGLGLGVGLLLLLAFNVVSDGGVFEGIGTVVVVASIALMAVVALMATVGPALKGLRIDPAEALRTE